MWLPNNIEEIVQTKYLYDIHGPIDKYNAARGFHNSQIQNEWLKSKWNGFSTAQQQSNDEREVAKLTKSILSQKSQYSI